MTTNPIVNIADVPLRDAVHGETLAGVKNADPRTATFKYLGRSAPADYWDGEG
jgi:hypothetical protein